MTVLVLGVLVVLGYTIVYSARVNLHAARNARDILQQECAAESALNYAIALLKKDGEENDLDTLDEPWAEPGFSVTLAGSDYYVTIIDESRKLNVNRAAVEPQDPEKQFDLREALKRLTLSQGGAGGDYDAIRAWIDPETVGFHEDLAPNRPLPFISGLRAIPGLDRSVLEPEYGRPGLEALLSTHPEHININTASEEVLAALWDDQAVAEEALDRRRGEPFQGQGDILSFLQSVHASSLMKESASVLQVRSDFFTVSVAPRGPAAEQLAALVRREKGHVRILHIRRFFEGGYR